MPDKNSDLLTFAKDIAQEAGTIMLAYFYKDSHGKGIELKHDMSLVTLADKEINQLVIDRVSAKYPEHGVLSEEGSENEDRSQLWVCDPIDGTREFAKGIPTSFFSLAYVVDGVPQVAVVLDPVQDMLYSAVKGQGAFVNDNPLRVSTKSELTGASTTASASYSELIKRKQFFDSLEATGAKSIMFPGSLFRGMLVARGDVDATLFPGRSAHDIAAAKLIVEEAGGKVTDLYGKEQPYNTKIFGAIITNGHLHDKITGLVNEFGPEDYIGY